MSTVYRILSAVTIGFAAEACLAQQQVQVALTRGAVVAEQAAEAIRREGSITYGMETGRRFEVVHLGDALRVRYGRRPESMLRHDGQGRFVSTDGALVVRFELDSVGTPDRVHLEMPAAWR